MLGPLDLLAFGEDTPQPGAETSSSLQAFSRLLASLACLGCESWKPHDCLVTQVIPFSGTTRVRQVHNLIILA